MMKDLKHRGSIYFGYVNKENTFITFRYGASTETR